MIQLVSRAQLLEILSTFHPFSHHFDYLHFFGYLYYQSFGIDACFWFKHHTVGNGVFSGVENAQNMSRLGQIFPR